MADLHMRRSAFFMQRDSPRAALESARAAIDLLAAAGDWLRVAEVETNRFQLKQMVRVLFQMGRQLRLDPAEDPILRGQLGELHRRESGVYPAVNTPTHTPHRGVQETMRCLLRLWRSRALAPEMKYGA